MTSGMCDNFPAFVLSEGRRHGTLRSIPTLLRSDSHLLTIINLHETVVAMRIAKQFFTCIKIVLARMVDVHTPISAKSC